MTDGRRNIKLVLGFDGTAYHGWQIQKNAVTVQETVTRAARKITGENTAVTGCGRTDTGVHALNYVCSLKTSSRIPEERFAGAMNANLPDDIVCKSAEDMPGGFDAARSATGKTYIYRILNSKVPNAFERRYAWHYKYPLDTEKMREAAKAFLGEHDFIGFASAGLTVKTTVRTIHALEIEKSGDIITLSVTGNGFLYNMVRIITGTLVMMGGGKTDYRLAGEIIRSKDRNRAGITAPAHGLFLKEVYYGGEG